MPLPDALSGASEPAAPPQHPEFAAIYAIVRSLLGRTATQLPDNDPAMEEATFAEVSRLLGAYPCITSGGGTFTGLYADVSAADKPFFDGAAARFVAAALRPVVLNAENAGSGALIEEQVGAKRVRFASYNGASGAAKAADGSSVEAAWQADAARMLGLIPCVRAARANAPAVSLFAVAGRSRSCTPCRPRRGCF